MEICLLCPRIPSCHRNPTRRSANPAVGASSVVAALEDLGSQSPQAAVSNWMVCRNVCQGNSRVGLGFAVVNRRCTLLRLHPPAALAQPPLFHPLSPTLPPTHLPSFPIHYLLPLYCHNRLASRNTHWAHVRIAVEVSLENVTSAVRTTMISGGGKDVLNRIRYSGGWQMRRRGRCWSTAAADWACVETRAL